MELLSGVEKLWDVKKLKVWIRFCLNLSNEVNLKSLSWKKIGDFNSWSWRWTEEVNLRCIVSCVLNLRTEIYV